MKPLIRVLVLTALSLSMSLATFALPKVSGCNFGCIRGYDLAHCVEYFGRGGNMTDCEEIQLCWRMGDEFHCNPPTCRGGNCYDV